MWMTFRCLVFIISGAILTGLPFIFPGLWPLVFIGPLSLLLEIRKSETSRRRSFFLGLLFGTIQSGIAVSWLWHALPLSWLVENQAAAFYLTAITWILTAGALGIGTGIFAVIANMLATNALGTTLLIPFIWIIGEEIRMWGYALLTLASNSLFGPHFSFGALGYPLAHSHLLLQIADPGGIRSLSFFAMAVCALLSALAVTKNLKRRVTFGALGILLAFCVIISATTREEIIKNVSTNDIRVALITTYLSMIRPTESLAPKYQQFIKDAAGADVIIFPEGYGFSSMFATSSERDAFVRATFGSDHALIISNTIVTRNDHSTVPAIEYFDTQEGVQARYEKMFLTPQGESVPYLAQFLALPLQSPLVTTHIVEDSRYAPGHSFSAGTFKDMTVGGLFCGEIISPLLYSSLVDTTHPSILVNLASQAWFNNSKVLYEQTKTMAQVHAVQHRLPFLTASNGSPSYVIDATGILQKETPWNKEGVVQISVQTRKE